MDSLASMFKLYLVGGFNPSEIWKSVGMMKFPIYGKLNNVPNHQPDIYGTPQFQPFSYCIGIYVKACIIVHL